MDRSSYLDASREMSLVTISYKRYYYCVVYGDASVVDA